MKFFRLLIAAAIFVGMASWIGCSKDEAAPAKPAEKPATAAPAAPAAPTK